MNSSKEKLFNENFKLVHHVLHKKFQGFNTNIPGYEYEDLVQIGGIGLWKACLGYNIDKSIKFSTYAIHIITNEILQTIRNNKNKILNDSISFNSLVKDKDGKDVELYDLLSNSIALYDDISLIDLKSYINKKYADSEIKLNIINTYIFESMNQCEIAKKYGYSQPQVSRILNKFKNNLKYDFGKELL